MHTINEDALLEAHKVMKPNKACGIDEVTKQQYEDNITDNIRELLIKMKKFKYRPQPVKRVYIPKADGNKKRPLGITTYEYKLVQYAMNNTLNAIFENQFLNCSYGFRNNKDCHKALKALNHYVEKKEINYVVDADIKGFFDNVDHKWLMKFLEHKIQDRNFLRYIGRFLKSGILENGKFTKSYKGTPQGGIISPTLANIYLHYVLDIWFEKKIKKQSKGLAYLVRYADDFVCCFQHKEDADSFYSLLVERLAKFNLEVAEDKTKIIYFGKKAYYESRKFSE